MRPLSREVACLVLAMMTRWGEKCMVTQAGDQMLRMFLAREGFEYPTNAYEAGLLLDHLTTNNAN